LCADPDLLQQIHCIKILDCPRILSIAKVPLGSGSGSGSRENFPDPAPDPDPTKRSRSATLQKRFENSPQILKIVYI